MELYQNFLEQFNTALLNADRNLSEVELIAVSKKKSLDEIKKVINSGHLSFGENQLQEVENKWDYVEKRVS